MAARRCIRLLAVLTLLLAAGCDDVFEPSAGALDGTWRVYFNRAPADFIFELREESGGVVTGTWSHPPLFYRARATGERAGASVLLTMDSPNAHFSSLEVTFSNREWLEGTLWFGGQPGRVRLRRVE